MTFILYSPNPLYKKESTQILIATSVIICYINTAINDFIKFSKEIENLIPKVYFDKEEKEEEKNREGRKLPKEIILSEYFI